MLFAAFATCALLIGAVGTVAAQTPQGATLTVNSGQVGVVKANGAQLSPARSGLDLGVGDQVGTVGNSNALVTFFEGTELELGKDTAIVLREIRSSGNEVHVTIEDVFGVTNSRLKAFVNPNSSYQVQNPGGTVVAVGRGTTIYFNQVNKNQVVGLFNCNPQQPQECFLLVSGRRFNGPGIFLVREGAVTRESSLDQPPDAQGIPDIPGPAGGKEGGDNPPGQQGDSSGQGGTTGGFRAPTPLTSEVLASRIGEELNPFSATGSLLALGMLGWTFWGPRSGRRH